MSNRIASIYTNISIFKDFLKIETDTSIVNFEVIQNVS